MKIGFLFLVILTLALSFIVSNILAQQSEVDVNAPVINEPAAATSETQKTAVTVTEQNPFPLRKHFPNCPFISTADLTKNYDNTIIIDVRSKFEFDVVHIEIRNKPHGAVVPRAGPPENIQCALRVGLTLGLVAADVDICCSRDLTQAALTEELPGHGLRLDIS